MVDLEQLGEYRNEAGNSQPVLGVALLNPDGSPIARNEFGLTPYESKVIKLLAEIRDRLPAPAAKPAAVAPVATAVPGTKPKA